MSDERVDDRVDARTDRRVHDVVNPRLGDDEIAALELLGTRVRLADGEPLFQSGVRRGPGGPGHQRRHDDMTKPVDESAPGTATAPAAADVAMEEGRWVTTQIDRSRYRSTVEARTHEWVLDEPVGVGGTDTGPTPYETLLGTLGGCTAITLRMYADRKGWPLEGVRVRLRQARAHEPDCEICETEEVGPHRLEREIDLEGPLTDEQRRRLMIIADRCPVKQTLERGIRVVEAAR